MSIRVSGIWTIRIMVSFSDTILSKIPTYNAQQNPGQNPVSKTVWKTDHFSDNCRTINAVSGLQTARWSEKCPVDGLRDCRSQEAIYRAGYEPGIQTQVGWTQAQMVELREKEPRPRGLPWQLLDGVRGDEVSGSG